VFDPIRGSSNQALQVTDAVLPPLLMHLGAWLAPLLRWLV